MKNEPIKVKNYHVTVNSVSLLTIKNLSFFDNPLKDVAKNVDEKNIKTGRHSDLVIIDD